MKDDDLIFLDVISSPTKFLCPKYDNYLFLC